MKLVLQKVKSASVRVNDKFSEIGPGLLLLIGIRNDDIIGNADYLVRKCLSLRLWSDETENNLPWKLNVKDKNYEILIVSQFTLYGTVKNGSKPDFHYAMNGKDASVIFNSIVDKFKTSYNPEKIKTGFFGEQMEVNLINDGPVTLIIENETKSS
ncbi:hypothetical protein FG379_000300 [Cryptosporidium bovis]|uniref:uncharacterized protein n=1 Tax=Cryptosporidium bovis TaxID=310047 RepID=UPI003519E790|nr:hypothetical protein FG379_000300 [Cryptosporidium bovis]